MEDPRESFNELMDTPLDFSAFVMNRLKVDTLTPELLTGPTYELMKGSCKSLVELEYLFEEVYKSATDQLDWKNPEGQQYPHDLRKPLPLIPNSRGLRVIPFDYFINNDLEYLSSGVSSRKYTTSVTETKAEDYEHIKWIENLVLNRMWSQELSRCLTQTRSNAVTKLQIVPKWQIPASGNGALCVEDETRGYINSKKVISKKGFRIQDIEKRHSASSCVESYQKKLNLTKPDTYRSDLKQMEAYFTYSNPKGFIYQIKDKKNRLMRIDELHMFSDGTLNDVQTALNDRLKGIRMHETFDNEKHADFEESDTTFVRKDSILYHENPIKEILLKLNLHDHRSLKMEVVISRFPEVIIHKMAKLDYALVDDLKVFKITSHIQVKIKEPSSSQNVQHKLFHLDGNVIVDFIVALHMFTRSLILKRRVEDLQLGVESYQKKLNITKPQKTFPEIEFKEPYTPS
ncbi:hypothetical protein Tco_1068526 [Tanacetum coccineum]|uniref:Uncharacterized protein n=1 Tax=Tanacetum coccineum TaxID=301880 RepID=A0ABQ5HGU6_9ASTR